MAVRGAPRTVLRRGDLLVKDETFVGRPGTGEFLRREKYRGRNAAPAA
jgi:dihydropyrimidinase